MISALVKDLINKVSTVPALSGKVGAVLGGTEIDPTMSEIQVPFAWVVFGGDTPMNDDDQGMPFQRIRYHFSVVTAIGYGVDEQEVLDVNLPVLQAIQSAVTGTRGLTNKPDLWKYEGKDLNAVFPNRLVYHINFSIIGTQQKV